MASAGIGLPLVRTTSASWLPTTCSTTWSYLASIWWLWRAQSDERRWISTAPFHSTSPRRRRAFRKSGPASALR